MQQPLPSNVTRLDVTSLIAGKTAPTIPDFIELEHHGVGVLGTTWRGRLRVGRDSPVAVKVLYPLLTRQPGFVAAFEKETAALRMLAAPQIAPLLARGKFGEDFYVATELQPGGNLRERLRRGKPGVGEAVRIALEILRALKVAHGRGLPHRALKPENVVFTSEGEVRVTDFGLSVLLPAAAASLSDPYRAPELAPSVAATPRADLFALGVMLYEMLSGELPPRTPSQLRSGALAVSAPLEAVVLRALEPSPDRRTATAMEFIEGLLPHTARITGERLAAVPSGPSADALELTQRGQLIEARLPDCGASLLERQLGSLEELIGKGGPWKIAYDLSAFRQLGVHENQLLIALHERQRQRLASVAFASRVPVVRGSALVVGSSVKDLPWKIFDTVEPMRAWMSEGRAA